MTEQRVVVTYTAPLSFQASDNWKQFLVAFSSQLPLRNLHWSSPSRPSIRTIQELQISLCPFETLREERTSQVPLTLLERPFLNLYFITCDDVDVYRTMYKKIIKEWMASVVQRKQEWLVVHVVAPDTRQTGSFFQMKSTVIDKLKADFNTDKRDRCVQLAWTSGKVNPAAWVDAVAKIKECLLLSFDSAVSLREEEVRRSESQRQMPGWNFCTFFILKESLAISFEGMNLLDDALVQYDELEALFFLVLRDKNLSWFGTLISPEPQDDSAPLLAVGKKPYRDLILANNISVFDFRIYLLSRQCGLLGRLGKIVEVARKASAFIAAFGRRLREGEANAPEFFIESWSYSSALSVVEQCDAWASDGKLEPSILTTFNACKGELLELARNQLDVIGIKIGYLPSAHPFSLAFPSGLPLAPPPTPNTAHASQQTASNKISRLDLLASINDREKFYELYINLTKRAIEVYAKNGRKKFALKLHCTLAALDAHRGQYTAALQTYISLPAHYAPHTWTSLESLMFCQALDIYTAMNKAKDREWLHLVLSFLKSYTVGMEEEFLMAHGKRTPIEKLVKELVDVAGSLEEDIHVSDHPALSIQVTGDARLTEQEDGSLLDVTVYNRLPNAISVDELNLVLAGREMECCRFTSQATELMSGKNLVVLSCTSSSSGVFVFDSSEIRVGRLHFQSSRPKIAASAKGMRDGKNRIVLVRIPRDLHALDVRIRQPYKIELGASAQALITISTGRNSIPKATLRLSAPLGVMFQYGESALQRAEVAGLDVIEDGIVLKDIANDETVDVLLPYSTVSAVHTLKVNIDVEYITFSKPDITRTMHLTRTITRSLPVAVNVQDFFRGTTLFSKFTVSATTHQHVRISSARIEVPNEKPQDLAISASLPQKRGVITVTPAQTANFLFCINSPQGPVQHSLCFVLSCRTLREDVEGLITQATQEVVSKSPSLHPHRRVIVNKVVEALESDSGWVEMFRITGEVNVPDPSGGEGPEESEGIKAVKELLRAHRHSSSPYGEWREIRIPVDVPHMNVVAAACIRFLPTTPNTPTTASSHRLYAGQPISAVLTIETSFHWSIKKSKKYMMRFDVEEMMKDWLISGRKRGNFVATDKGTFKVPITLIAIHHGLLSLPRVAVEFEGEQTTEDGVGEAPSTETYQDHGAEKVLILPRGGRTTYVVPLGEEGDE